MKSNQSNKLKADETGYAQAIGGLVALLVTIR